MSEANGPAGHAAILRSAANLIDALNQANATPAADEVDAPRPVPERQPTVADPEAQQRAEAEYMLACLKRDLPDLVKKREDR